MKLYGEPLSLFCTRVLLAARVKGLDLPLAPLPGGSVHSAEFLRINPIGKMPVLEHNGEHLVESEVIIEYLDETQPGPSLLPGDPLLRARSRLLARIVDLYVMPPATAFYRNLDASARDPEQLKTAEHEYRRALSWIEHHLRPGPYAVGAAASVADCALAPLLDIMSATILPRFDAPDPLLESPKLLAWRRRIEQDPVFGPPLVQYRLEFQAFMRTS